MLSGIAGTATHFAITVKKNITGNKLYVLYKTSVQNKSVCPIDKQQLLFACYCLNRAGGFHFQSISIESFLIEKFVVSGSCYNIISISKIRCLSKNHFQTLELLV